MIWLARLGLLTFVANCVSTSVVASSRRAPPGPPKLTAPRPPPFETDARATAASPIGPYFFNQLLDHSNPSLGTFPQRYWFNDGYYNEGGPIVLFNA